MYILYIQKIKEANQTYRISDLHRAQTKQLTTKKSSKTRYSSSTIILFTMQAIWILIYDNGLGKLWSMYIPSKFLAMVAGFAQRAPDKIFNWISLHVTEHKTIRKDAFNIAFSTRCIVSQSAQSIKGKRVDGHHQHYYFVRFVCMPCVLYSQFNSLNGISFSRELGKTDYGRPLFRNCNLNSVKTDILLIMRMQFFLYFTYLFSFWDIFFAFYFYINTIRNQLISYLYTIEENECTFSSCM